MKNYLNIRIEVSGIRTTAPFDSETGFRVSEFNLKFGKKKIPNCLAITYKIDVSKNTISDQNALNILLKEEIDSTLDIFSLLLNRPFEFINFNAELNGKTLKFKQPPTSFPLRLYSFESPIAKFKRDFSYSTSVTKQHWANLFHTIDAFRLFSKSNRERLRLPLHWFAKASNERYPPDRFIGYWIAFNGLYSECDTHRKSEIGTIRSYLTKNKINHIPPIFLKRNKKFLETISDSHIKLMPNRRISEELHFKLNSNNASQYEIMELSILTLYGIRNNLFHGDYDLNSSVSFKLLENAEIVLSNFLQEIIIANICSTNLEVRNYLIGEAIGI